MKRKMLAIVCAMAMLATACGTTKQEDKSNDTKAKTESTDQKEDQSEDKKSDQDNEETESKATSSSEDAGTYSLYPVAFGKGTEEWRQSYLDYLNDMGEDLNEGKTMFGYSFIDVDGDQVPEFVVDTGIEAGGCQIVTWHDGKTDVFQTSRLGVSYVPGQNALNNSDGHMGGYYDQVVTIKDGKWDWVFRGSFETDPDREDYYDESGNIIGDTFYIDDKEVTRKEYYATLGKYFNSKKAITPEHYYNIDEARSILETGFIKSQGHEYELFTEDCTWKEAYEKAQKKGGRLATLSTDEEFDLVTKMIKDQKLTNYCFYVGATRDSDYQTNQDAGFTYEWLDDDVTSTMNIVDYNYDHWLDNGPSYSETLPNGDEIDDEYIELIYQKKNDKFLFNDVFNDVIGEYPSYKGRMGYVVEYDK